MRNIFLALVAGPLLFGCLTPVDPVASIENGNTASGNRAPTIAGQPAASTKYDERYEFKPKAADADGDTLTFSVQNKPSWANFSSSTGMITGRPTMADLGTYDGITVSVSDGTSSAKLPPFSVTVSQTALGVVTLSWDAPTQNSDGSPLMDLAGFNIYYRKNSGSYEDPIRIDGQGNTTIVVEELSPATYYFAATSFNASGDESWYSSEVAHTVN